MGGKVNQGGSETHVRQLQSKLEPDKIRSKTMHNFGFENTLSEPMWYI